MLHPRADDTCPEPAYRVQRKMFALYKWFTRSGLDSEHGRAPIEVIAMRCFGLGWLGLFLAGTLTTHPYPALHGRGAVILLALVGLVVAAVATQPQKADMAVWRRVAALVGVTAATALLAGLQPAGPWQNGPLLVGLIAAIRLDRKTGILTLWFSVVVVMVVALAEHRSSQALSLVFTAVPWFLVMRLMREIALQRNELRASREAEARAAASAERGRLAREMHDVLAHSLSALALQLESTRLLATSRNVDPDVERAIDQAHQLAATGLQDARRAIATARGDELPGPDRISVLAEAFGEQSGLPVAVEVRGEPRELAPDARLAVYRTAQEALTNIRRHATAERVEIELSYLPQSTVLVVEDRASDGVPPPAPLELTGTGYGLTGMRERAELLGGKLLAQPTGHGFRVELELPV
jgi:signal transduction histidine kinase